MSKLTSAERLSLWTERFERFHSAQVTVAEFCRCESVSVATFYRWKEQLNPKPDSRRPGKRSHRSNAKFVPVIVQATSPTPKLSLPGGASIDLPSQLDSGQLADLVAAVIEATEARNRQQENH